MLPRVALLPTPTPRTDRLWRQLQSSFSTLPSLRVLLEGGQLLAPKTFDILHPRAKLSEALWLELIDAHSGVVLGLTFTDQPALAQHTQVAAHGRTRHG